jgi:hypothetical protein
VPVLEAASILVIEARQRCPRAYAELFGETTVSGRERAAQAMEWSAKLLERKNADLRALLNAVDEPALHFVRAA